tara:strand:- start:147 stop:326 length:180 start_codon:yes stop_codon:yes gene_type:complete
MKAVKLLKASLLAFWKGCCFKSPEIFQVGTELRHMDCFVGWQPTLKYTLKDLAAYLRDI